MKKTMLVLLVLMLICTASCAGAEDSLVQVIMNAGTTQAFSDAAVAEDDLNAIVKAGLAAASAINQQPWYFAVITNPDVMAELSGGSGMPAGGMAGGFTPPAGMQMPEGMTPPAGMQMPEGMTPPAGAPAATGSAKAALGDSPVAIVIYMNEATSSPNASFDCGLACQNMVIAASALGYGTKIISSPTMTLNGANHDALCEKLGVDPAYQAVAVLLIGQADADAQTSASIRNSVEEKVSFVK